MIASNPKYMDIIKKIYIYTYMKARYVGINIIIIKLAHCSRARRVVKVFKITGGIFLKIK